MCDKDQLFLLRRAKRFWRLECRSAVPSCDGLLFQRTRDPIRSLENRKGRAFIGRSEASPTFASLRLLNDEAEPPPGGSASCRHRRRQWDRTLALFVIPIIVGLFFIIIHFSCVTANWFRLRSFMKASIQTKECSHVDDSVQTGHVWIHPRNKRGT